MNTHQINTVETIHADQAGQLDDYAVMGKGEGAEIVVGGFGWGCSWSRAGPRCPSEVLLSSSLH